MELPIRRRRDRETASDPQHTSLHRSLSQDLERWPRFAGDLVRDVAVTMRDVTPAADIEESDDRYVLHIELPGLAERDVSVEVDGSRVVVTGERRERRRTGLLRHQTRTTGRFRYAATLPLEIDQAGVTATVEHGLLTINAPKAEASRRRRIPVVLHR